MADADTVRVTKEPFNPKRRHDAELLFTTSDTAEIAELKLALSIDPASLEELIAWMTMPLLEINFMRGRELLTSVGYLFGEYLRWPGWGPDALDARLRNPEQLERWLMRHGWRPPPGFR
jgi:hypothetical protein